MFPFKALSVNLNGAMFAFVLRPKGRPKFGIPLSRTCQSDGKVNIIKDILDCDYKQALKIYKSCRKFNDTSEKNLKRTGEILCKVGMDRSEIYKHPELLGISPLMVEHHAMVLQEGGFKKIDACAILNYIRLVRKRASLFKAYGFIPEETDIAQSFLSYTEPAPENVEPYKCPNRPEKATFSDLHTSVMRYYLSWRLQIDQDRISFIIKTYKRFPHKSLRLMVRTLKILEEDVGLSRERIINNAFLIHSHPDNTLNILQSFTTLGGLDIRTMLVNYPKIIMTNADSLQQIEKCLKEHGISNLAIQRCPHIFTLSCETVRRRLEQLKEVPEFQALVKHPRVLRLVHYQKKAQSRLDYLQEAKVRCVSLHVLCTTLKKFQRYINEGSDKTKGTDMVHYLSSMLEEDVSKIRSSVQLHPFYCHVPIVDIKNTLELLLKRRYTNQQILKAIQLVLYPRSDVEYELDQLPMKEELTPARLCVDSEHFKLSRDHHLSLCLYYLERRHHFTGNGVWPIEVQKRKELSSSPSEEVEMI